MQFDAGIRFFLFYFCGSRNRKQIKQPFRLKDCTGFLVRCLLTIFVVESSSGTERGGHLEECCEKPDILLSACTELSARGVGGHAGTRQNAALNQSRKGKRHERQYAEPPPNNLFHSFTLSDTGSHLSLDLCLCVFWEKEQILSSYELSTNVKSPHNSFIASMNCFVLVFGASFHLSVHIMQQFQHIFKIKKKKIRLSKE